MNEKKCLERGENCIQGKPFSLKTDSKKKKISVHKNWIWAYLVQKEEETKHVRFIRVINAKFKGVLRVLISKRFFPKKINPTLSNYFNTVPFIWNRKLRSLYKENFTHKSIQIRGSFSKIRYMKSRRYRERRL